MYGCSRRREFVEGFLSRAAEELGLEEFERLKLQLEKTAEALWRIEGFRLEPFEEPSGPPGEG